MIPVNQNVGGKSCTKSMYPYKKKSELHQNKAANDDCRWLLLLISLLTQNFFRIPTRKET